MCPKLMQNALQSEGSIFDKSTEQRFCDALERALATYSYDEIGLGLGSNPNLTARV